MNVAGGIVVVSFKRPVDIDLEKLQTSLPNIVGVARRDPDGRGFRFSLTRKATVNSMAAGERVYIDLSTGDMERACSRPAEGRDRGIVAPRA